MKNSCPSSTSVHDIVVTVSDVEILNAGFIVSNPYGDIFILKMSDIMETKSVYFAHLFPMVQKKSLGFILTF